MMELVEPVAKTAPDGWVLKHRDDRCNVALLRAADEVVIDDMLTLKSMITDEGQRCR